MYKIFVESYPNVVNLFNKTDVRYKYIAYMNLLCDKSKYQEHKSRNTKNYMKVSNLLTYINDHMDKYKRLQLLMSEFEYLGILPIKTEQLLTTEEMEEGAKILNSIVKLNYWQ